MILHIALRLHDFLNNTHAGAGQYFCKRLRVWHRQRRASCHSSFDSRGPILCNFVKLDRLLQFGHVASEYCSQHLGGRWPVFSQPPPRMAPASARFLPRIVRFPWPTSLRSCRAWSLASNGACWSMLLLDGRWAVRALALPRTARHALEPARAARHLAVSMQQAAPAVTRAPHACRPPCRAPPFTCRLRYAAPHRIRSRRAPVAAATACAPAYCLPLPLPAMHRIYIREGINPNSKTETNRNQTETNRNRMGLARGPR